MSSILLLPNLSNLNLVERFLVKLSSIKFHEDVFRVSRVASTGEIDGQALQKATVVVPSVGRTSLRAALIEINMRPVEVSQAV